MPILKCTKHGEQEHEMRVCFAHYQSPYQSKNLTLCPVCFSEAMIKLGVCALFPVEQIETPDWIPEELGEKKA